MINKFLKSVKIDIDRLSLLMAAIDIANKTNDMYDRVTIEYVDPCVDPELVSVGFNYAYECDAESIIETLEKFGALK